MHNKLFINKKKFLNLTTGSNGFSIHYLTCDYKKQAKTITSANLDETNPENMGRCVQSPKVQKTAYLHERGDVLHERNIDENVDENNKDESKDEESDNMLSELEDCQNEGEDFEDVRYSSIRELSEDSSDSIDEVDDAQDEETSPKRRGRSSWGWNVVKKIGGNTWQCMFCSGKKPQQWQGLGSKDGCTISNVTKHVLRKHPIQASEYLDTPNPNVEVNYNKLVMEWILRNNHPFNIVDNPELSAIFANCGVKLLKRSQMTRKYIPIVYEEYKAALNILIGNNTSLFALSSDGWSSNCIKGKYISCVVIHFIDDNWQLHCLMLEASNMNSRHTSVNIQSHWRNILEDWNLNKDLISCITVDGGSDYSSASKKFGKSAMWCFCHRLNLVTKHLVDNVPQVKALIEKGKKIVGAYKQSTNFQRELINEQEALKMRKKIQLQGGCETRWNSYCKMLQSLLSNKQVLENLKEKQAIDLFSLEEWKMVKILTEKMNLIAIFLREMEATNSPTIHMAFPYLIKLRDNFISSSSSPWLKTMEVEFLTLFVKYFGISSCKEAKKNCRTLIVASFLDPRTKGFEFAPEDWREPLKTMCKAHINSIITDLIDEDSSDEVDDTLALRKLKEGV